MITETTEAEMRRKIKRFGFDHPSGRLEVGAIVDCIIGRKFTPNGNGNPIRPDDREGGIVLGLDEFGNWEVRWPNGQTYSYEAALLAVVS